MVVVTDSYMGVFLPINIDFRINQFLEKKLEFPFIEEKEIIGTFYIFGKSHKVTNDLEILSAYNLAKRAIEQTARNIKVFNSLKNKLNSNFIREEYHKRILQISIDENHFEPGKINRRITRDPSILSSCFEQHITYYKQDYFFKLFKQPFKANEVPSNLSNQLEGRVLMIGYNVSDLTKLPNKDIIYPFFNWLTKNNH